VALAAVPNNLSVDQGLNDCVMPKKPVPQPPPHFEEWKRCLFQRPRELCCIFDKNIEDFIEREQEYEFKASPSETLGLFTFTMRNLPSIVDGCSERQIVFGLNSIFNSNYSEICHDLIVTPARPEARLHAINSIYDLYARFFALRCTPVLFRDQTGSSLEGFHFMIWDFSAVLRWASIFDERSKSWPFLDVLERVLYIPHNGCIQSALHGFGHAIYQREEDNVVPSIIDRFLTSTPGLLPELRLYALAARTGQIQ
jgi:hypothetical protein